MKVAVNAALGKSNGFVEGNEMIRNLVALIMGIIACFLAISIAGFILINFQIDPFYYFLSVTMSGNGIEFANTGRSVMCYFIFIISPLVAITTGFVAGLIALSRPYIVGVISILPFIMSINLYAPSIDSLYISISSLISVSLGILIAKSLRSNVVRRRLKSEKPL